MAKDKKHRRNSTTQHVARQADGSYTRVVSAKDEREAVELRALVAGAKALQQPQQTASTAPVLSLAQKQEILSLANQLMGVLQQQQTESRIEKMRQDNINRATAVTAPTPQRKAPGPVINSRSQAAIDTDPAFARRLEKMRQRGYRAGAA